MSDKERNSEGDAVSKVVAGLGELSAKHRMSKGDMRLEITNLGIYYDADGKDVSAERVAAISSNMAAAGMNAKHEARSRSRVIGGTSSSLAAFLSGHRLENKSQEAKPDTVREESKKKKRRLW